MLEIKNKFEFALSLALLKRELISSLNNCIWSNAHLKDLKQHNIFFIISFPLLSFFSRWNPQPNQQYSVLILNSNLITSVSHFLEEWVATLCLFHLNLPVNTRTTRRVTDFDLSLTFMADQCYILERWAFVNDMRNQLNRLIRWEVTGAQDTDISKFGLDWLN